MDEEEGAGAMFPVCIHVGVYLHRGNDKNSRKKSLGLEITLRHGATQKMSLGIAKPRGQQCDGR